jgi:hypothetical protein
MSNVIKQHWVPRCYLKHFSNEKGQLYVFDKYLQKAFPASIEDIAEERYFHDIEELKSLNLDKQFFENAISEIETEYSQKLESLLEKIEAKGEISEEDKNNFSFFISFQYFRTKSSRNYIKEALEKMYHKTGEFILENRLPEANIKFRTELSETATKLHHMQTLFDGKMVRSIAAFFSDCIWLICKSSNFQIYTSDNPVAYHHHLDTGPFGQGLVCPGVEFTFPLSKHYVLSMYERNYWKEKLSSFENKVIPLLDQPHQFYKSLQVNNHGRQIYCTKDDFQIAESLCKLNPHIAMKDREQLEIN